MNSLSHNTQIFEEHANIGAVLEATVQTNVTACQREANRREIKGTE